MTRVAPILLLLAGCSALPRLTLKEDTMSKNHGTQLDGAFIALLPERLKLPPEKWTAALDEMRARGWKWLILADRAPGSEPAIETILSYADEHGMHVALTVYHDRGWQEKFIRERALFAAEVKEAMRERWLRFGHHACIWAWYDYPEFGAPLLPWEMRAYYKSISAYIDDISPGKLHIISPYYVDGAPYEAWRMQWSIVLRGSGIDILILQDGVGVRQGPEPETQIPVWRAMADACKVNDVRLWANCEAFRHLSKDPITWRPATPSELEHQIQVASAFAPRVVCWEAAYIVKELNGD